MVIGVWNLGERDDSTARVPGMVMEQAFITRDVLFLSFNRQVIEYYRYARSLNIVLSLLVHECCTGEELELVIALRVEEYMKRIHTGVCTDPCYLYSNSDEATIRKTLPFSPNPRRFVPSYKTN